MSTETCSRCGESLLPGWTVCPRCANPTGSGLSTCPTCGGSIEAHWKVCPNCSQTISSGGFQSGGSSSSPDIFFTRGVAPRDSGSLLPDIPPGELLDGRFEIVEKLGTGAFGDVFRAKDSVLDEEVALKLVLLGVGVEAEESTNQLLHEYKVRRQINDTRHIIKAADPRLCDWKGISLVLLPMEVADGGTLRDWMNRRPPEVALTEGIQLFRQAAEGVRAIHEEGLLHLDLKPENILLSGGVAKITDFGLGRFALYSEYANNPDQLLRQGVGTPVYMSPEQFRVARQRDISASSDIYSLGILLYEILDGAPPFDGGSHELKEKHLGHEPSALTGDLAPWWPVVRRCLEKSPGDRYSAIADLLGDLDRVATGATLSADVACPSCGHLNRNLSATVCESCQTDLLDSAFWPCPRCARDVRRDQPVCPGCGMAVGDHYLALERRSKLDNLVQEDPVEAIALLELILKTGVNVTDDDVELVRFLREAQKELSGILKAAGERWSSGEAVGAIQEYRKCFRLAPRHRLAKREIARIEKALGSLGGSLKDGRKALHLGQFEKALEEAEAALKAVPSHSEAVAFANEVSRLEAEFTQEWAAVQDAQRNLALFGVRKAASRCVELAPGSSKAGKALKGAERSIQEVEEGLLKTRGYMDSAEFERARDLLADLATIQADESAIADLERDRANRSEAYRQAMREASANQSSGNLSEALSAARRALKAAPKARDALDLAAALEGTRSQIPNLISDTQSAMEQARFEEARKHLSEILKQETNHPEALQLVDSIRKKEPAYLSHEKAADERLNEGDLEAALHELEKALGIAPKCKKALEMRKQARDRVREAEEVLARHSEAVAAGNFGLAEETLTAALTFWPCCPQAASLRGVMESVARDFGVQFHTVKDAIQTRRLGKAEASIRAALEICPQALEGELGDKSAEVQALRKARDDALRTADRRVKQGDFQGATECVEEAQGSSREDPKVEAVGKEVEEAGAAFSRLRNEALEALQSGDLAATEMAVRQARKISPDSKELAELATEAKERKDRYSALLEEIELDRFLEADYQGAESRLKEAEAVFPKGPDLSRIGQELRERRARHTRAMRGFRQSIETADVDGAQQHLDVLKKDGPKNPELDGLKKEIQKTRGMLAAKDTRRRAAVDLSVLAGASLALALFLGGLGVFGIRAFRSSLWAPLNDWAWAVAAAGIGLWALRGVLKARADGLPARYGFPSIIIGIVVLAIGTVLATFFIVPNLWPEAITFGAVGSLLSLAVVAVSPFFGPVAAPLTEAISVFFSDRWDGARSGFGLIDTFGDWLDTGVDFLSRVGEGWDGSGRAWGISGVVLALWVGFAGGSDLLQRPGIRRVIADWETHWEERDLGSFMDHYAPDFYALYRNLDRHGWQAVKDTSFVANHDIRLEVSDLKVTFWGRDGIARASFLQAYESHSPGICPTGTAECPDSVFSDFGRKFLLFQQLPDGWKIIREEWTEDVNSQGTSIGIAEDSSRLLAKTFIPRSAKFAESGATPGLLFPYGWSESGLIGYVAGEWVDGCGCYFLDYRIHDAISDEVVWSIREELTPLGRDPEEIFAELWVAGDGRMFRAAADSVGIQPLPDLYVADLPAAHGGKRFFGEVRIGDRQREGMKAVTQFQVVLHRNDGAEKVVSEERYGTASITMNVSLAGFLQSPFEPRIALILVEREWELGGSPDAEKYSLIGAHLEAGFPSA